MTLLDRIDRLATTRTIERSGGHLYTYVDQDGPHGPYPGATAVTGLQDSLGGSDGLMNWGVGLALDEIMRGLQNAAMGGFKWDDPQVWESIRTSAFQAKNEPRDIGTAVHLACHRFNENLPLELTEVTAPYVAHYAAALRREGIEILSSERYVVNVQLRYGGTYDSLVTIGGEMGPLDVKTGKEKASQRLQLTGLSMGQYHGGAGLEAEPMPALDSVGWILLLRPNGYQLVRHDITDEDRDHFIRLVATFHAIREWSNP